MYSILTMIETEEGVIQNIGKVYDSYEEAKKEAESIDNEKIELFTGWKVQSHKIVKISWIEVEEVFALN